ncbi:MAG: glycosyltransferase [Lachnospiraceae bacterium]|nr:glycosyltransferase [Lachnospiraceae bacterium]
MIIGEFSEAYPPTIDGVAGVVHNYCKEMTRRGHRCIFIGPNNKKTEPSTDYEVLLYRSVKPSRKLPYRLGAPQMQPGFRALIDEIPFDLVHAHTPFMSGRFAREVARKRGIPLVATFHSKYYDDSLRVTGSPFISRRVVEGIVRFYESCDEVWTVNRRTAMVLRGYGYRGPIVVMQNGIDPAEEREVGDISDLGLTPGVPQLLFVGQQDYKKGTRQLLDACGILHGEGFPFRLVMVGEGQDQLALAKQAGALGIGDDVIFTGRIADRPRLMAIYKKADLFVFPSVYDNAPLVVREAALAGTPSLVVTGSCAAEGMEDGVNGFLCDGTPEDIARKIREALPAAERVGREAYRTIPITWEKIGGYVEERYGNLIEKKTAERDAEQEEMIPDGTAAGEEKTE